MCLVYVLIGLVYVLLAILYLFCLEFVIPGAAVVAAIVYTVAIPGCYLVGLFRVLAIRPATLPPEPAWYPRRKDDEPAELSYAYGFKSPAFAEIQHVVVVAYELARGVEKRGRDKLKRAFKYNHRYPKMRLITVPLAIGGAAGMVCGIALGAICFAAIALIHAIVATMVFLLLFVAGGMLRLLDTGMLRVKNIRMTCPNCYERVPYPAYKCTGPPGGAACGQMHKDIRPGRYGIFRRRCRCSTKLPTLLLLGSARHPRLTAFCLRCDRSMEHRPGEAREIVLPLFGAAGAGKTRLMYGLVTLLRSGLEAEFADTATVAALADVRELLAPGKAPAKTAATLPRGQVLRIKSSGGTRLLQMFDGAGERFYKSATTEELGYLNKARTFVLVIDPLSIDRLWDSLPEQRQRELALMRSPAPSPDLAYEQTHQEMEKMGVRLKKARLAVVFSRADLLDDLGGEPVQEWAKDDLGLGNLVRSVSHQFGEIAYFRTASVLDDGVLHPSVEDLARWLMTSEGVTLPERVNGVRA